MCQWVGGAGQVRGPFYNIYINIYNDADRACVLLIACGYYFEFRTLFLYNICQLEKIWHVSALFCEYLQLYIYF